MSQSRWKIPLKTLNNLKDTVTLNTVLESLDPFNIQIPVNTHDGITIMNTSTPAGILNQEKKLYQWPFSVKALELLVPCFSENISYCFNPQLPV